MMLLGSVVLDADAWLWTASRSSNLPFAAASAIKTARRIILPSACVFELLRLVRADAVELDRDVGTWVRDALRLPRLELFAPTPAILAKTGAVYSRDPLLATIAATALTLRAPLVSRNPEYRSVTNLRVVWETYDADYKRRWNTSLDP